MNRTSCLFSVFSLMIISTFGQVDNVGSGRTVSFDGVNDYVNLGNVYDDLVLPFSVSAWVWVDPTSTAINPILVSQDNAPLYNGFWFSASSNGVFIEYGDGQGEGSSDYRRGKSVSNGSLTSRWIHVTAVVVNANDIELYVNGINAGGDYTGSSSLPMASSYPGDVAKIGYFLSNGFTYHFKGKMDEIRLWNRALTETEIRSSMCKTLTGTESGLIGYWNFNEVNGNALLDKSSNSFNGVLQNSPSRQFSGAPVGDESAFRYTNAWTGTTVTMNEGSHTVEVSDVQGNPQGVHIYTVRSLPSQISGLSAEAIPPYFGVFSAALDVNNRFDVTLDNNACGFFTRKDNSEAAWIVPASLGNTVDRTEVIIGAESADLDVNLGTDESFCPFTPQVLSPLQNPSGYQFLWQNGSTQPTFTATDYGTYWVVVSNACQMERDTITFTKQISTLSIDLGPDEIVCPVDPRMLSPLANPTGFEFTWQDGSKQSSFQVSDYGKYWVTIENSCSKASDTITIKKPEYTEFFIPNVITPNNDSKNQFFIIDEQLAGSYLAVYNRWGKQVYESSNYQNNWDGRDLPVGMYFYYITNSCTENMKGFLSIIR